MSSPITTHTLAHLAALARINLTPHEEEQLLADLKKILAHVAEFESVSTKGVPPMTGGTALRNALRDDALAEGTNLHKGPEAFPEIRDGFLSVPPVFE